MKRSKEDVRKVDIAKEFPYVEDLASIHNSINNYGYTGFAGRSIKRDSGKSTLVSLSFSKNWGNNKGETSSMGSLFPRNLRELAKGIISESANGTRFLLTKSPGISVDIEYDDRSGFYRGDVTAYLPLSMDQLERLQEIYRRLIPHYLYSSDRDPFKNQPKK